MIQEKASQGLPSQETGEQPGQPEDKVRLWQHHRLQIESALEKRGQRGIKFSSTHPAILANIPLPAQEDGRPRRHATVAVACIDEQGNENFATQAFNVDLPRGVSTNDIGGGLVSLGNLIQEDGTAAASEQRPEQDNNNNNNNNNRLESETRQVLANLSVARDPLSQPPQPLNLNQRLELERFIGQTFTMNEHNKRELLNALELFERGAYGLSELLSMLLGESLCKLHHLDPSIKCRLLSMIREIYIEPKLRRESNQLELANKAGGSSSSLDLRLLAASIRRLSLESRLIEAGDWEPLLLPLWPGPEHGQAASGCATRAQASRNLSPHAGQMPIRHDLLCGDLMGFNTFREQQNLRSSRHQFPEQVADQYFDINTTEAPLERDRTRAKLPTNSTGPVQAGRQQQAASLMQETSFEFKQEPLIQDQSIEGGDYLAAAAAAVADQHGGWLELRPEESVYHLNGILEGFAPNELALRSENSAYLGSTSRRELRASESAACRDHQAVGGPMRRRLEEAHHAGDEQRVARVAYRDPGAIDFFEPLSGGRLTGAGGRCNLLPGQEWLSVDGEPEAEPLRCSSSLSMPGAGEQDSDRQRRHHSSQRSQSSFNHFVHYHQPLASLQRHRPEATRLRATMIGHNNPAKLEVAPTAATTTTLAAARDDDEVGDDNNNNNNNANNSNNEHQWSSSFRPHLAEWMGRQRPALDNSAAWSVAGREAPLLSSIQWAPSYQPAGRQRYRPVEQQATAASLPASPITSAGNYNYYHHHHEHDQTSAPLAEGGTLARQNEEQLIYDMSGMERRPDLGRPPSDFEPPPAAAGRGVDRLAARNSIANWQIWHHGRQAQPQSDWTSPAVQALDHRRQYLAGAHFEPAPLQATFIETAKLSNEYHSHHQHQQKLQHQHQLPMPSTAAAASGGNLRHGAWSPQRALAWQNQQVRLATNRLGQLNPFPDADDRYQPLADSSSRLGQLDVRSTSPATTTTTTTATTASEEDEDEDEDEDEEDEEDEEEDEEEEIVTEALVPSQAEGRLPLSVAEQMSEQANKFVQHHGSAQGPLLRARHHRQANNLGHPRSCSSASSVSEQLTGSSGRSRAATRQPVLERDEMNPNHLSKCKLKSKSRSSSSSSSKQHRHHYRGQNNNNNNISSNNNNNLQVRRTLRVKIRKSKPILGIAIEGGFNVSGQLLPRIVCVHEMGAAYECGKLRASDLILEVNGISTVNMTHDQIAKTIANAYYQDERDHIELLIGESVPV